MTRNLDDETILRPQFLPDQRGLISELVRRLMERRGLSAEGLSAILGQRLNRTGPAADLIEAWRSGEGSPPPGDVLAELMKLARQDPELVTLVDALIGPSSEAASAPRARQDRRPLRVFLSHTSELREHPAARSYVAAAEAAIVRAGHAIAHMAYFVARDMDPVTHCVAVLAETDLYVGIIGFRYGALVPGRPQSFMEMEFEKATALGLPRLVFLLHEEAIATLPNPGQPPELTDRQTEFRRCLQNAGVTVVRVRSPHDLELSVLHALIEFAAVAQVEAGAASSHGALALVPANTLVLPSVATRQPNRPPTTHAPALLPRVPVADSLIGVAPDASLYEPGHEYVAAVRRAIQEFVSVEMQMGSNELAPMASRYLRTARRRLDSGQYNASIERELQAALAELAQVVAWLLHDAGRQDASRQAAYEALYLARLAGSPQQLDLFILGNLAHVEIFTGRPGAALHIARAALGTDNLSSRLTAMFRIREARALAQLGDRGETERALAAARSELLDGVSKHDPPWSWWLDEPELVHHSGQAFASLGAHNVALPLLEQANEDCPPTRISGRFIYLAHSLSEAVEANAWSDFESIVEQTIPYAQDVGSGRAADVVLEATKRLEQLRAAPSALDAGRRLQEVLTTSVRQTHAVEGDATYK